MESPKMQMLLRTGVVLLTLAVGVVSAQAAPNQPNQPAQLADPYEYAIGSAEFWGQFGE